MVNDIVFSWPVCNAEVLTCFQEFFLILIAHAYVVGTRFPLFTSERNNRQGNLRYFFHLHSGKKVRKITVFWKFCKTPMEKSDIITLCI
jgi:hypothetical protein